MSFDWSQYLSNDDTQQTSEKKPVVLTQKTSQETEQPFQEQEKIDWSQYSEENKKYGDIPRHIARTASRLGESLVGLPGDVVSFVKWLDSKMPELPKFLKKDPNFLQKQGQKLVESFPTSSELKEKMSDITSGFTDPQSAIEEFGDSITELATMLTIGKNPAKIKNLLSALGKATVAKTTSKTAEKYGAGPGTQTATELGTLMMMGFLNKDMASKFVSDKYKRARNLIPPDTMIHTGELEKKLISLENELSKGITTTTKSEVKSAVKELKNKIAPKEKPKISITTERDLERGGKSFSDYIETPKGEFIGELGYEIEENKLLIDLINVSEKFRRSGYATALIENIIKKHPEKKIVFSPFTEDGAQLISRLTGKNIRPQLTNTLEKITEEKLKDTVFDRKDFKFVIPRKFPAQELVDSFHDINERMTSKRLFGELSKPEQKKLRFRYNQFKNKVATEIRKYGEHNSVFLKEWKAANQAFKTIEDSKAVTKFLESHMGKLPSKVAGSMAIELFMGHPEFAAATAGSFGAIKKGELLYRIGKSPTLRKHYLEALRAASEENLPDFIKSTSKLDYKLKKSFTKP